MSYNFTLSWNNREVVLPFPVIPNDGIIIGETSSHQAVDALSGQMLLIGRKNLRTLDISSFFPRKPYGFLGDDVVYTRKVATEIPSDPSVFYDGDYRYERRLMRDGLEYVQLINAARDRKIPFRAILTMDGVEVLNMPCAITQFSWGRDQAGDVQFTLKMTEYVFPSYEKAELGTQTTPTGQTTMETTAQVAQATVITDIGTVRRTYTDEQAKKIACHIISGEGYTSDVYYNPTTCYGSYSRTGGYTRLIKRETLYAAEAWLVLNTADKYDGGDISKTIRTRFNNVYFDYRPDYMSKIYNYYGCNVYELVKDVLDRRCAEKEGKSNVGRVLPKEYLCQWGDSAYAPKGVFLTHYFDRYIYGDAPNGAYGSYISKHLRDGWQYTLPSPYGGE